MSIDEKFTMRVSAKGWTLAAAGVAVAVLIGIQVWALPEIAESTLRAFPELAPWYSTALVWGWVQLLLLELMIAAAALDRIRNRDSAASVVESGYVYASVSFAAAFTVLSIGALYVMWDLGFTTPGATWGAIAMALFGVVWSVSGALLVRVREA
ncbi:hypothetical protein GCM10028787_32660 [Brachybacterium horti]